MLNKVKKTIEDNSMLCQEDKVLVALSGGCDSICLCLVLKQLNIDFSVAHLNHMIRSEAKSDLEFCKGFAEKIKVPFYSECVNVPEISKKEGISEELAGRNARYDFFERLCNTYGFTKIAVAHNLNDNAETVLLNLIRGSGVKGLCGIPKTRGKIIRPLIDVTRCEIEQFVKEQGQDYVTDKTNFLDDYTRNKVRNNIIPILCEINQSALSNISKTGEILSQTEKFLENLAKEFVSFERNSAYINVDDFKKAEDVLKSHMLFLAYEYAAGTGKDFEKKHIDYIKEHYDDKQNGNIIELCFEVVCRREYGKIIFEKKTDSKVYSYTLGLEGEVYVKEAGIRFTSKIISTDEMKKQNNAEFFDADLLKGEIIIRSRNDGDKMIPFGKNSQVKIKDILIKDKVPKAVRKCIPIIECGEILWLFRVRRSNLYKISENTQKVLMIKGEV